MTTLTEDQLLEFRTILNDVKGGWAEIKGLPESLKRLQDENTQLKGGLDTIWPHQGTYEKFTQLDLLRDVKSVLKRYERWVF